MFERVAIFAPLVYIGLFLFIRLFGKRTLSNMNALDLVVTVAIGSTIPTVILTPGVGSGRARWRWRSRSLYRWAGSRAVRNVPKAS
jgi:hypothetical protein